MENRRKIDERLRVGGFLTAALALGISGMLMKNCQERKLVEEYESLPKVSVSPKFYGQGMDSLTRTYIGDRNKFDRDLRHRTFLEDNPGFCGNLNYHTKYVVRSNDSARASN